MLFNSISFAIFLPVVFVLYWFAAKKNPRLQNVLLLVSSYFFYACWDWRFMFLLLFSTLLDYFTGNKIYEAKNRSEKLFWFWLSIGANLCFLGFFKYYNFFVVSFADGLSLIGINASVNTLQIILPVGISFYTFHALSYIIDIYKERIQPEKNLVDYAVFVSFFPLLVAGPIERATHLLPQIRKTRVFNYDEGVDGLKQILWGLFKKIVIADSCAVYANTIFNNSANYAGSTLLAGALFFSVQIYCDFSGYSDIAIGTARLFGIDLLRNFAFPYFSRNIAEFWRRWHISLSSWFKDYLYIPMGGSKGGIWVRIRNTFIIFIVCGFWHGANWTFIVWGLLNALYILPSILLNRNRKHLDVVAKGSVVPTPKDFLSIVITFSLTVLAWIFFRASSLTHAFNYIAEIFSGSLFTIPQLPLDKRSVILLFLTALFFILEWLGREQQYAIEYLGSKWYNPVRWCFYYVLVICILLYSGKEQQFIYFQF